MDSHPIKVVRVNRKTLRYEQISKLDRLSLMVAGIRYDLAEQDGRLRITLGDDYGADVRPILSNVILLGGYSQIEETP